MAQNYYYKFRVYFDEVEDFVRDIEILAKDNFFSFHSIIYSATGLLGNELASFFICDSKWNKQKEITLINMEDDSGSEMPVYDEDDDFSTKSNLPKSIMIDSALKDFIADPHQQLIYEYDFLNPKIFYIELIKIDNQKENVEYPICTFKEKELPKESKEPIIAENDLIDDDFENDFEDDYNEEDTLDFEALDDFNNGF